VGCELNVIYLTFDDAGGENASRKLPACDILAA
jgi:hypothetical protein